MTHTTTPDLEIGDRVKHKAGLGLGTIIAFTEKRNFEIAVEWDVGSEVYKILGPGVRHHSSPYIILVEKGFQPYDPLQQGEEDGDI